MAVPTGWLLAVVLLPVAALGLPPARGTDQERIERAGRCRSGLAARPGARRRCRSEQAVTATLRSTSELIDEVTALVARLRARWDTETALRAFADDLDDVTGDLIAANLILAARRRNRSLAAALAGVAQSVADDVAARRRVEADRAKPRGSARLVTGISLAGLGGLALTGDFVPHHPGRQAILAVLLTLYAGALLWMRKMAKDSAAALPRPRRQGRCPMTASALLAVGALIGADWPG